MPGEDLPLPRRAPRRGAYGLTPALCEHAEDRPAARGRDRARRSSRRPGGCWRRSAGSSSRSSSSAAPPSTPTAPRSPTRCWRPAGAADAVLLGAVGGPQWDSPDRPHRSSRASAAHAPQGPRAIRQPPPGAPTSGAHLACVGGAGGAGRRNRHPFRPRADRRPLLGEQRHDGDGRTTPAIYTVRSEDERIARVAFVAAHARTSAPSSRCIGRQDNILATARLWRKRDRPREFPDVEHCTSRRQRRHASLWTARVRRRGCGEPFRRHPHRTKCRY